MRSIRKALFLIFLSQRKAMCCCRLRVPISPGKQRLSAAITSTAKPFSKNGMEYSPLSPLSRLADWNDVVFRYSNELALEDAVHTAILTLKESFEGQMTEDNIEIGICDKEGFRRLTPAEVKDYLAQIA